MKFFKVFLVIGAIVFWIAGLSHRAWGTSPAIPVIDSRVPFSLEKLAFQDESSGCFLDSKIDDDRLLEIEFTQTCLNEKMELPELLYRTEKRINDNEQFPLKVRNTQYSLIDDGIKVKSEMSIDYPVIGLVTLALDQDIFINLTEGKIDLQAGETQLNLNVSSIPIENFSSLIDQVVESQFTSNDNRWSLNAYPAAIIVLQVYYARRLVNLFRIVIGGIKDLDDHSIFNDRMRNPDAFTTQLRQTFCQSCLSVPGRTVKKDSRITVDGRANEVEPRILI